MPVNGPSTVVADDRSCGIACSALLTPCLEADGRSLIPKCRDQERVDAARAEQGLQGFAIGGACAKPVSGKRARQCRYGCRPAFAAIHHVLELSESKPVTADC